MLFDTHTHLNDDRYKEDFQGMLGRAVEAGVTKMLLASYDIVSSHESTRIASTIDGAYCAIGIHPHDAISYNDDIEKRLMTIAAENRKKVVAIGEIGLDYHYDDVPADIQKSVFLKQMKLAYELDLPVVIHDREAHGDIMDMIRASLKDGILREKAGVFHCYSGSLEMAEELLKMGFYISFAGPVTFKNARKIDQVMAALPDDRILIETDCPYLAPEPFRGKRNEPSYVRFVAAKLAELKGISVEEAGEMTTQNACRLFGIE